jgi:hypothetical protein
MKILYIDAVGPFGGASRSLFEVLRAMPEGAIEAYFVMQRGTAQEYYGRIAKDIITARGMPRFDHTRFSYYRGVRWLVVLRELFYFPFMVVALIRARLRWRRFDLIHVNEISDIIPGLIAKWLFGAPMVVHVRSLQNTDQTLMRTHVMRSLLLKAERVIAIDEGVLSTIPQ